MLRSIAKIFEFKETSISKATLRRILILMVLSIPAYPLAVLLNLDIYPNQAIETVARIIMTIGLLSLLFCLSTRFVNRFYFPDKYLDEWEIKIKHKSMTFAFMIMFWVVPLVIFALLALVNYQVDVSGESVFFVGMGIFLGVCYIQIFHALWQVRPIDEDAFS